MIIVTVENQVDSGREGAEAAADGPGGGDEEQRVSVHCAVLRGAVQGGRLLDLHGADGHKPGQAVQVHLRGAAVQDTGEYTRQDHSGRE